MSFFKERKTPAENIAFMGIICAVNAVFSLISAFLPIGAIFIMLVLSLGSALVAKLCKNKYWPIYLLAAIAISVAVTAWDFSTTLFYTIPAICCGLLFGILKKIKVPTPLCILGVTVVQIGFTYLSILLINAIYGIDMPSSIIGMLGLSSHPVVYDLVPSFVISLSLAQSAISSVFMTAGIFDDQEEKETMWASISYPVITIALAIFSSLLILFDIRVIGYALLCFCLYLTAVCIFHLISNINVTSYVIAAILIIVSVCVFAMFNAKLSNTQAPALIATYCVSIAVSDVFNVLSLYKKGFSPLK